MPGTFYINCGSDYHTKEALNGFRNKMEQCCELLDFQRGKKIVKTTTKDIFIFVKRDDLYQYESEPMIDRPTFKKLYHEHRKSETYKFINRVQDLLDGGYKMELPQLDVYWFAIKRNKTKEEVVQFPVVSTSQLEARRRFKKKYRPTYPMEEYNYKFRVKEEIPEIFSKMTKEEIEFRMENCTNGG